MGKRFPWLEYDGSFQGAFFKICRKVEMGVSLDKEVEVCESKAFPELEKGSSKDERICQQ